ncbi:MAG TPA: hypothetical protein VFZ44_18550 [Pyrinomonadaceae bacterium]
MFKTAAGVATDFFDFAREVLWSRVGLVLFLLHLTLVSCAYAAQDGSILEMLYNGGDSLIILALFMVNLPMIIITALVTSPVLYERRVEEFGVLQWVAVSFCLFCILFQWWFYGYLIERLMNRGNQPSPLPHP